MSSCLHEYVDMIRTQIQLKEEELQQIREEASRQSCSISAFIRESALTALAKAKRERQAQAVLELGGKYGSGLGDLAEEHDAYLSEE